MIPITDFYRAAESDNLEVLKSGIESIKNIDALDYDNLTALGKAIANNRYNAVQLLLDAKASTAVMFKEEKTIIQWAREQKEGDIAKLIMLYNYMDRLYNTSIQWEKAKLEIGVCDICSVNMKAENSMSIEIDDVFESSKYTDRLYEQVLNLGNPKFAKMSKEEILKYLKKQIKDYNSSAYYMVCSDCIKRFFENIIYGNFKDYLLKSVEELLQQIE